MSTFNAIIKKRNVTNNGWDSVLPITIGDNVILNGDKNLTEELSNIWLDILKIDRSVLNVKEYGVKGDGLTNDTTLLQSLINDNANKKTILIPEGIYMVNGIRIPDNSHVVLLGTLKLITGSDNQLVQIQSKNVVFDGRNKGVLDGNGLEQNPSMDLACIYGGNVNVTSNVVIKGLEIMNAKSWGANICATNSYMFECVFHDCPNMNYFGPQSKNCIIKNCTAYNITNDYALGFYGGVQDCIIDSCIAYNITTPGLFAIGVVSDEWQQTPNKDVTVSNCIAYDCQCGGIGVWGWTFDENITFVNCVSHHNNKMGGDVTSGFANFMFIHAKNVLVTNCISHDSGKGDMTGSSVGYFCSDLVDSTISNCFSKNEGYGGIYGYGFMCMGTNITLKGNTIINDTATKSMTQFIQFFGGSNNKIIDNNMRSEFDTSIYGFEYCSIVRNNYGSKVPYKILPQPPTPVANVQTTNDSPFDVELYISGGDVSIIAINFEQTGLTSGVFRLKPKDVILQQSSTVPPSGCDLVPRLGTRSNLSSPTKQSLYHHTCITRLCARVHCIPTPRKRTLVW